MTTTWEDFAMSSVEIEYIRTMARTRMEGFERGRLEGRAELIRAMPCQRFDAGSRSFAIADRLALLDYHDCVARISAAADLDELAEPDD